MIIAFVRFSFIRRGLVLLFLISATVGISCAASYRAVPHDPDSDYLAIKWIFTPGDKVRVTTIDNRKVEFKVVKVTDEAIIGENEKVLFTDISNLEEMTAIAWENFNRKMNMMAPFYFP